MNNAVAVNPKILTSINFVGKIFNYCFLKTFYLLLVSAVPCVACQGANKELLSLYILKLRFCIKKYNLRH